MRKRTIRQGQISQRRRSKRPFMEHTLETKRRKEERRSSGEATIREDSSREEERRQVKRKKETRGEDERLQQKKQSEKRPSRVFPTVPQAHKEKLFPPSSPLLGASCLFSFFFSPGRLLLVLCRVLGSSGPVTACVSLGGRLCICQLQCLVSCSRHFVDTSGQTTEVHLVFAFCLPWPPAMWKALMCRRMSCDLRMMSDLRLDSK